MSNLLGDQNEDTNRTGLSGGHLLQSPYLKLAARIVLDCQNNVWFEVRPPGLGCVTAEWRSYLDDATNSLLYSFVIQCVAWLHLSLLWRDPISSVTGAIAPEDVKLLHMEFALVLVYCMHLIALLIVRGISRFSNSQTLMVLVGLCILFLMTIGVSLGTHNVRFFRYVRALRPGFLLCLSHDVRMLFYTVMGVLPRLGTVFMFGAVVISFYSVIGMALFHDMYDDEFQNFDSFVTSALAMSVLTTTENFPDILYDSLRYAPVISMLFFISFFFVGVWLFMSLILAVVYDDHKKNPRRRKHTKKSSRTSVTGRGLQSLSSH